MKVKTNKILMAMAVLSIGSALLITGCKKDEVDPDANEVLRTLTFIQKQIPAKNERWFSIRIMPYRTFDDRIDGLVITFINLSDLKQVELKLHETEQMNRSLLHSFTSPLLKLSPDGKIQEFNPDAERFFGKNRADVLNQDYIKLFVPEKAHKKTQKGMKTLLTKMTDNSIKMQVITAGGKIVVVDWSVNVLLDHLKTAIGLLLLKK